MGSLKERLAAKARRTITVPVQVSDPGPARAELDHAERKVSFLELTGATAPDPEAHAAAIEKAVATRSEARKAFAEHFVEVEFAAATPKQVEQVLSEHAGDDGSYSEDRALAPLAALCAVDEDLADAAWWTEQLESGIWTRGERGSLWTALLDLNLTRLPESLPKD